MSSTRQPQGLTRRRDCTTNTGHETPLTEANPVSDDDKLKIQILLKEYDTLRAEILARTDNRFGLLTVFTGIVGAMAAFNNELGREVFGFIAATAVLMLVIWFWLDYLIGCCSERLKAIEESVNKIAGDELLEWESRHSPGVFWTFVKSRARPTDSGETAK